MFTQEHILVIRSKQLDTNSVSVIKVALWQEFLKFAKVFIYFVLKVEQVNILICLTHLFILMPQEVPQSFIQQKKSVICIILLPSQ